MNFFVIFYEFSITRLVGTKRNDNFYFPSLSVYSNLLWLEMKPQWYFYLLGICFLFFWNFLLRVGYERNGMIIFVFRLSRHFPTCFGYKRSHNGIFLIFLNFFLFFWNFLLRVRLAQNRSIVFIFSLSQHFPHYFGFKWSHNSIL